MAAADLLIIDSPIAKIFDCKVCTVMLKKERGCVRPKRQAVQIYKCPVCAGENKKCIYCKGTNEIMLKRCPRAILNSNITSLVPYFFSFINSHQYPDGRGRLFQPIKMLKVFDIWAGIYYDNESSKRKADRE
jgi:hypothetical protein